MLLGVTDGQICRRKTHPCKAFFVILMYLMIFSKNYQYRMSLDINERNLSIKSSLLSRVLP
jgi:hypothetical protein